MDFWYLLLSLLFVLANGYFVAAEFSIVKVRSTQLEELAAQGSALAGTAREITRKLDEYLSATQLGVTLSSLALGWIGEPAFAHLLLPIFESFGTFAPAVSHSVSASFAFVMISILHIVFGELVPKSLAIQKPVATTLFVAHPLRLFFFGMFPVIWVLNGFSRLILRGIGVQPANERDLLHSPEELKMLLLASARESGEISAPRKELIEGVFQFSRRTAKQIMVPRTDVHVLSVTNSIQQNLEIIRSTRHTRYPLCEGDLDRTIGLIHVKDILIRSFGGPGQTLADFQRDVFYVPENTTVERLLEQFIAKKTHLAIVVDEYGGASGIVSMENITEELFGQIQDEFDKESLEVEPLDTGQYKVRGDYLIEDLAGRLRVDLGDPPEETIGGYIVAAIGREVSKGDSCELGSLKLEVLEGARYRVKLVLVTPQTTHAVGDGKPE